MMMMVVSTRRRRRIDHLKALLVVMLFVVVAIVVAAAAAAAEDLTDSTVSYFGGEQQEGGRSSSAHRRLRSQQQQAEEVVASTTTTSFSIFYHIHFPTSSSKFETWKAMEDVKEQLQWIADSDVAAGTLGESSSVTVYYNTMGAANLLDMDSICASTTTTTKLNCVRLGDDHYSGDGQQDVTLRELHGYCSQQQGGGHRVAYLNTVNRTVAAQDVSLLPHFRKLATKAVTSKQCTTEDNNTGCNLCALENSLWPFVQSRGNVFTADCTYVRTLLPPAQFKEQFESLQQTKDTLTRLNRRFFHVLDPSSSTTRFDDDDVFDLWIGSSPDVSPCDLSGDDEEKKPRRSELLESMIRSSSALAQSRLLRFKEYSLLAGRLFQWFHLYNKAPASDSWVWKWFPDGKEWKEAVAVHGESAMDALRKAELAKKKRHQAKNATSFVIPPASKHVSVFYNLFAPVDYTEADQRRIGAIVKEQIQDIGSSYVTQRGKVTFYYNTIGGYAFNKKYMDKLCNANGLVCQHMDHFANGWEDVTLNKLHQFCVNPDHGNHRVIYIHPKGSFHTHHNDTSVGLSQEAWRKNMIKAVTSEMCVKPPDDTCTACGLMALPFPGMHFAGNFFTAKCSYVRKLLPPTEYARRKAEVTSKGLSLRISYGQFVSNIIPDHPCNLGVERFASEHWLGSHPSVAVCDLADTADVTMIQNKLLNPSNFEFAMFPRNGRSLDERWSYIPDISPILARPELSRREFYFLPGLLLKWYELYDEIPADDSWVWQWYPDGARWLAAVQRYGRSAIPVLTGEFVNLDGHRSDATFEEYTNKDPFTLFVDRTMSQ